MRTLSRDEHQSLLDFTGSLLNEHTPRAMVIVGAARLEEELKEIARVLAPGFERDNRSHGSRIELLKSLALITEDGEACLRAIAKIRNHFSHTSVVASIDDTEISAPRSNLFQIMETRVNIDSLTAGFFEQLLARVPEGLQPEILRGESYRKYIISVMITHHLPEAHFPEFASTTYTLGNRSASGGYSVRLTTDAR
jgi:hypothetical protein